MNTDFIKGIIVPIITPIDNEERIDEQRLRRHVDFLVEGGVHGILAFGSNSEFYMVTEDEMERGLRIMVEQAAGRIPVYMGVGAINTGSCIRIAKMGVSCGADGISVLQPMFIRPTDEELYLHFKTIAQAIPDTPMLLYNNPGRTGYTISANVVERLARDVNNIVGMKDSSGDITQTEEFIRRGSPYNFKVLCGKDTMIYAGLCHGGVGSVCTVANFLPELAVSIYDLYTQGKYTQSLEEQYRLNPIRLTMDKASFPVGAKDLCNLMGMKVGLPYKPNLSSGEAVLGIMRVALQNAGYLPNEKSDQA